MKYKVVGKQDISRMCFVCGEENNAGLRANFYNLENDEVVAIFTPRDEHQSYPNRLHGGLISAIMDETLGRSLWNIEPDIWGVTTELKIKYKKPVPLNQELKVVGRIIKNSKLGFTCSGEMILPNGEVAVTGEAQYFKIPLNKIADFDHENEFRTAKKNDNDPLEIEI